MLNSRFGYSRAKYWLYSEFEYYSNNILFVFVFGHKSESEYYLYSYSGTMLRPNIICICIRPNSCARILFIFVFGHNSEPEYYSYSYSAKYLCTNIIRIRIRSFWENEYYSYSYSVKILIPNIIRIRIRSKKQYSLTSGCDETEVWTKVFDWVKVLNKVMVLNAWVSYAVGNIFNRSSISVFPIVFLMEGWLMGRRWIEGNTR